MKGKAVSLTLAVVSILALGGGAAGQGYAPPASYTYDLATLTEKPGVIYVSPKYLTVLEFSDLIDELGTSRPSLLQIRVSQSENVVFLKALQQAGSADLVVRVGGYVALFRVVVDPKMDSPRRYVVVLRERRTGSETNPTLAPRGEGSPSQGTQPKASGSESPSSPLASTLPGWLKVSFSPSKNGGGWVIRYQVANEGEVPITLRVRDLVVRSGSVPVPFRVLRTAFGKDPEVLAPGEKAEGAILVDDVEEVAWEWKAATPTTYYVLQGKAP